jgi:hypothetical protein
MATGDVNGDGLVDLVMASTTTAMYVLLNKDTEGGSNAQFEWISNSNYGNTNYISLGNVVGDDGLDLIVADQDSVHVQENRYSTGTCSNGDNGEGNGCLGVPQLLDASCDDVIYVGQAKVDFDECVDVVAVCGQANTVKYYSSANCLDGGSTGSFIEHVVASDATSLRDAKKVEFGDVNGDGYMDAVIVSEHKDSYGLSFWLGGDSEDFVSMTFAKTSFELGLDNERFSGKARGEAREVARVAQGLPFLWIGVAGCRRLTPLYLPNPTTRSSTAQCRPLQTLFLAISMVMAFWMLSRHLSPMISCTSWLELKGKAIG